MSAHDNTPPAVERTTIGHLLGVRSAADRALLLDLVSRGGGRFRHLVYAPEGAAALAVLEAAGAEVRSLGRRRPILDLRYARRLAEAAAGDSAVLLHAHGLAPGLDGALAARRARRPLVVTLARPHGDHGWLERRAWRWLLRRAHGAALSPRLRRSYVFGAGAPAGRVAVLPEVHLPVPRRRRAEARERLAAELGLKPDASWWAAPGPLAPRGGHGDLLDAWEQLGARQSPGDAGAELVLFGDGPLRAELAARARDLPGVHLVAPEVEPAALLEAFDGVVFASLYDDLPAITLEAMAAGRAIVATSPGGVAEVVDDGREALVVPSCDAGRLAAALARLLDDPELGARLGRAARERHQRERSPRARAAACEGLYRRLIGAGPG